MNITKKDFYWNMIANITYSFISMILSFVIIMLVGANEGGLFSFGYASISQFTYVMSYFGMRSFHIIDKKYEFNLFLKIRIITSIIAIFIMTIYIAILYMSNIYTFKKTFFLFIMIISGFLDGFFDVYECELQRISKLYLAGQGLFFRTVGFSITLIFLVYLTKNIYISAFIATLIKIILGILLERNVLYKYIKIKKEKNFNLIKEIMITTFPLFISVVLDTYIHLSSKFSIDLYLGDFENGLFNILFMPNNIIFLICSFLMRPFLTPLSDIYNNDKNKYKEDVIKIMKITILISIALFILSIILSHIYFYIINIISNGNYLNVLYTNETFLTFIFLMLGGVFYAFATPPYYMLIIENKLKTISNIYIILFILSFVISNICVKYFNFIGAGIAFMIVMFMLAIALNFFQMKTMKGLKYE